MLQKLHENVKINYNMRQEIEANREPISALAKKFKHLWTNGMVERFNGKIKKYKNSRPRNFVYIKFNTQAIG